MKQINKHWFVLLVIIIFAFGCRSCDTIESSKLAQSEIYQDYDISGTKNELTATATFRVSGQTGTTIALVSPSKVEFNGKAMTANLRTTFGGSYYSASGERTSVENIFTFTDGDNKVYRNSISFEPVETNGDNFMIEPGKTLEIPLLRALTGNESLETSVFSDQSTPKQSKTNANAGNTNSRNDGLEYSTQMFQNLNDRRDAIVIKPDDIKNFAPGEAHISYLIRRTELLKQSSAIGGKINFEYRSADINVIIAK